MTAPEQSPQMSGDTPNQLERTVHSLAELHGDHYHARSGLQRRVERLTGWLGRPGFIVVIFVVALGWIAWNLVARRFDFAPFDPPPFGMLQLTGTLFAVFTTLLILATQRREDALAERRSQMTLELASLTEQKIAKVIQLVQEQRRDSPILQNRHDAEAEEMAAPADPKQVLDRIVETHEDVQKPR